MITAVSVLPLVIWVYLLVFHGRFWLVKRVAQAPGPQQGPGPPCLRVAVVIPARDEAETIGRALTSLARQDFPGEIRVFLVDDHSTDGTAVQARAAATGVVIIHSAPLAPGWTGKMWAVTQGLERAFAWSPDYILLTDADVEHSPDNLASLVVRAESDRLDLASYMVRLENRTFAEKFAIPAFVFFFLKLYPPEWIARRGPRFAGAAGGCMLLRTPALTAIGGVRRIRSEIIDDCSLAREIRREGGRIWLGLTTRTRSLRSYRTFGEISHMIARTAFTQLGYSPWLLVGTVLGMFVIYVVPPAGALAGNPFAAAAWALMAIAYVPVLRLYNQSPLWALALPLVAAFYTASTIRSAFRYWTGRGGSWKGRAQAARR